VTQTYQRSASPFRALRTIIAVLLIGLVGSFLLCAGGAVLLLFGAQRAVVHVVEEVAAAEREQEIDQARATALKFLRAVQGGDIASAADRGSRAFQARQSIGQWREWQAGLARQQARPELAAADLQISALDDAAAKNCRVILLAAGGFDVAAVMDLVKEKGRWTVDQLVVR